MQFSNRPALAGLITFGAVTLVGCANSSLTSSEEASASKSMDITLFAQGAFSEEPEIVDCETAEGTATTCYKLVTSGAPAGRVPGPFCPRTITDGADVGGGWFSKKGEGDLVDITGEFIVGLSDYYEDDNWTLYDADTGKIRYTATEASCLGAAKPDVEEEYKQNCIECELAYLDDDFSLTYLIPTTPIPKSTVEAGRVRTAGIALDGSELSGPAPVSDILGAYTIAAFDDCGGHINVHQGYHYHAAAGCTDTSVSDDGHAALIGYAADGYGIYAMTNAAGEEATLDECRGTTDEIRGYHYHAASPSENMFISCLHGESVRPAGGPPPGDHPDGPPPGAPAAG